MFRVAHKQRSRGPKEWKKRWGSASKASKGEGKGGRAGRPCMAGCPCPVSLVRARASSPSPASPPPIIKSRAGEATGGGASTCPVLRGGARLSRGISPSPWRRAVVARGVRLGSVRCCGGRIGDLGRRRGVARVGQPGVLRSRAGKKVASGKGKRLGLSGDRVSLHGCGLSAYATQQCAPALKKILRPGGVHHVTSE